MYPNTPLLDIETEFGMDEVAVSLHWSQESHDNLFVFYSISIEPAIDATITMISNTRANLTLTYNTPYSVSVVADFCGHQATTIIKVSHGRCMYIWQLQVLLII